MAVGNDNVADAKSLKQLKPDSTAENADASDFHKLLWIKSDEIMGDIQDCIICKELTTAN